MKLEKTFKRSSINTTSGKNQIKDVATNTILKSSESMMVSPKILSRWTEWLKEKKKTNKPTQQQLRVQWMSDKFKSPIINY